MADDLSMTLKLFAGAFVFFAEEDTGVSDDETKPISSSDAWKQIAIVEQFAHNPKVWEEEYDEADADNGWRTRVDRYTMADVYTARCRTVNELYERLRMGLESAITPGTAQSPNVVSNRMVRGWLKFQIRSQLGSDQCLADLWCEVRVIDPQPNAKGVMRVTFEFWKLASSLNSINYPDIYS